MRRSLGVFFLVLLTVAALPALAQKLDATPRTVLMTAYAPEWNALVHSIDRATEYHVNGQTLIAGVSSGKPVLLMQSGVSMVNAAMNTQMVIDRFTVRRIVFSGIAGGVDPALSIGDVVVPDNWAQYLEVSFARRTAKGWVTPEPVDAIAPPNFGMMFPRGVRVGSAAEPERRRYVIAADPALVALARKVVPEVTLRRCAPVAKGEDQAAARCLAHQPKISVGGTGVSAGVFADNAEFRTYLLKAWKARVLDMESGAVVQVAFANSVPVIVFRSLSDLAGGDAGANQMETFETLAASNSADVVRAFVAALSD